MMSDETITEVWKAKLAEPAPETEPVEMTFDGLPCKVRPLSLEFYLRSGRMPGYLARIAMHEGKKEVVDRELAAVSPEDVLAGQAFQRTAVCKVLAEPHVVDVPMGEEPEGSFSFMELAERRPAFVDAVFFWILLGCPPMKKEGEGQGLDAEALENFPAGKRGKRRAGARHNRKAHGKDTVGTPASPPAGV
jgi:hypothetical protein